MYIRTGQLFFSVDAETDGLYGEAFAIGAVVTDEKGEIRDSFCEKCSVPEVRDEWTRANCLPYLKDIPECGSREELRRDFWSFYQKYREKSIILADVPYPVEAQLFRKCVEENLSERCFQGPFPLIDVASILYASGYDPLADRMEFAGVTGDRHHPLTDAHASVLCLLKVLKRDG